MFKIKSPLPFLVVVTEDRYDMFADPKSINHLAIKNAIQLMGGISDTVEPGTYEITGKAKLSGYHLNMKPYEE